jgi:hypothetical protein
MKLVSDRLNRNTGQTLAPNVSLVGINGNALPNRSLNFDASLALGVEYDHRIVSGNRVAISAGVDFLASPNDVQLSQRAQNAPKSYAYIFLTPLVRAKFNPRRAISPWLELVEAMPVFCQPYLPQRRHSNAGRTLARSSLVVVLIRTLSSVRSKYRSGSGSKCEIFILGCPTTM